MLKEIASFMSESITILLRRWREGDETALSALLPQVYNELYRLASHYLDRERKDHTLQPTALINEAIINLLQNDTNFASRSHFIGLMAHIMRRVLVEYARKRNSQKRHGEKFRVTLTGLAISVLPQDIDLLALNEALNKLEAIDEKQMKIVELRYFCGLTLEETAAVLDLSLTTVKDEWSIAKAWLRRALSQVK
jgi:RNA polymerase sigma-70 factor, ECF subfamily